MKRALIVFLAAIGGVVVLTMLVFMGLTWFFFAPAPLPDRVVLEVDLQDGLVETLPEDPLLLALERRRMRTRDVVEALDAAADDPRVVGVMVRGGMGLPGWGTAEDLREAVARFRSTGKPAHYFVETFGELGPGQLSYHLATAFDRVMLQPSGEVGLAPLLMEAFFLADAFEELEIEPRFDARWEYKDAHEMFTRRAFSPDAREARVALLESLEASLVDGMSGGRGLPADSARILMEGGPYPAREAEAAGLVDALGYLDEARDDLSEVAEGGSERVGVMDYLERSGRGWNQGPRVALIYGVGTIHRGRSGYDPFTGGTSLGGTTVAAAIREAVDDPAVRAILFRVDSPGGSWVASDQVRREIQRARDRDIPVVVSMGDLAASGGYVVAMDADRVVAQPSTFTGSIGVVGGRFVTEDFFRSLGIDWDRVEATAGGDFYSMVDDFSPEHWERFQLFLDRIYDDFVDGVAQARGMSWNEAEVLARGRVWSGRDARERDLVDELGGFVTALAVIRELLEEDADAPLQVATYPAERTLLQLLLEEGRSADGPGVLGGSWVQGFVAPLRTVVELAARVGLVEPHGPVRMEAWTVPGR